MTAGIRKLAYLRIIAIVIFVGIGLAVGQAENDQPKLTAPGGAEMDLVRNTTKCFGTSAKPVEAFWRDFNVEVNYLEYNRNNETVLGQGKARMIQNSPVYRVITCDKFFYDRKREYIKAEKEVKLIYDDDTSLNGDLLEWDRGNDLVKVMGTPQINYKDWQIDGERIEGQVNKGIFIFFGPVKGVGADGSFNAGQIVFDRFQDKVFLKDNPVVFQGKNQFTAPEIVYDLKTRKVTTKTDTNVN